ncbi:MAG: hypothetical protein H0U18_07620 [Pyrinomonadaceae bacterium]|nr:hypothetical protein [Pyrinomonadaceae bacterium]
MNRQTARWCNLSSRLSATVGIIWICVGLRDLFAPHFFRFDGQVATTSTVVLDFAVGAILLLAAFSFHQAKSRDLQSKS